MERPIYYSPRHQQLTGETLEEALARTAHWLDYLHPADRARVAEEDARQRDTHDVFRAEYRMRRKDGNYVWVRDECVAVLDERRKVIAWQGVLMDVSDRIQAEEAQIRLAAIVASSSEAIISTTLDGIVTSWNPAAERLYGYSTAEAIDSSVRMLVPPELSSGVTWLLDQVRQGLSVEGFETERITKDGRRIEVSLTTSPIRDGSGTVVGISSVARDVTHLRQTERERDRLHAELEAEFQRAAEVQAQLLPHVAPAVPDYEFAGFCLPARQVGGDFFDWPSDGTEVRLSLGDVMGKGMPAALLTATARTALRSVSALSVQEAVEAVNRALTPDLVQSGSFITLFHARLEPESGALSYVDAGHGLAFMLRRNGEVELLRSGGLPLGIDAQAPYPAGETAIRRGDSLVIYSDGLPDARPDLELTPAAIAEWIADRPDAQAKLDRLLALGTAVEKRPDDLTVVIVRRRETGADRPARSPRESFERGAISRMTRTRMARTSGSDAKEPDGNREAQVAPGR
jgi:PAS domain S-box-containing protein